jgi:Flp pilus assembly protein TadD
VKLGKLDEALRLASQASSLAPDDATVLDTQGWVLFNRGEFAEASGILEKAVAKSGRNPTYHYYLAASYEKLNEREKALAHCNTAIKSSLFFPERPETQKLMKLLK